MEKKLTLREIVPYLPYGLKVNSIDDILTCIDIDSKTIWTKFRGHLNNQYELEDAKPILRPLSDLTKHECYTALSYNLRFNIDILGFPNYLDLKVNDYNILLE